MGGLGWVDLVAGEKQEDKEPVTKLRHVVEDPSRNPNETHKYLAKETRSHLKSGNRRNSVLCRT